MADNMLIDGLIKFCDEKSKNIKLKAEPQVFIEIKQALEDLKEYKLKEFQCHLAQQEGITIGYNKAIDEFAEKIKKKGVEDGWNCDDVYGNSCGVVSCEECENIFLREIDEIADQLKVGGKNE